MPLRPTAEPLAIRLLDLVFPPRCAGCGTPGSVLCGDCMARVQPPATVECAGCRVALAPAAAGALVGLCPRCQARGDVPLSGLRVAARYEDPVRAAILALKFRGQRRLAQPLGDLLAETGETVARQGTLVIPIPLHPNRQRQRGFNQS